MCLAIPGELLSIEDTGSLTRSGKVSFGGIVKDVCLAYVPDAQVGDYVIVHVGFALQKIAKDEAEQVFKYLNEMGDLEEIQELPAYTLPHKN